MARDYLTRSEVQLIESHIKHRDPLPVNLAKILWEAYARKRDMVNELEILVEGLSDQTQPTSGLLVTRLSDNTGGR